MTIEGTTAAGFANEQRAILLVDDSENDLFLMRMAFKKAEFPIRLQTVSNGAEAIAYLKGEGVYSDRAEYPLPTSMLLDLNMPMTNGLEVLAWVRAQPMLKRLCIIILTASMRVEDVEQAFDLGANSFLVKPASLEELTAMVRCLRDWLRINHFASLT
jgi:CheY-like chemotaxis protein